MVKDDKLYLQHMRDAVMKIQKYAATTSRIGLETNDMAYDAIVREIEILGEATKYLSDDFRNREQGIPWSLIVATRNKLIHEYTEVDLDQIWNTIQDDLPALKEVLDRHQS